MPKIGLSLLLLLSFPILHAQTATGILDNYIKESGGSKEWQNVKAIEMKATIIEDEVTIPISIYSTASGKQAMIFKFPGMDFTQMAFDGDTYWTTDFTTLEPTKASDEMIYNMKLSANDFPSPALNYRKNGYTIAFVGMEKMNGAETYKVKVTQEPLAVNGQEVKNEIYYYFDTKTYLPVAVETLQPNGRNNKVFLANYQKVEGLYFPFSIDQDGFAITVKSITINPNIDTAVFAFPNTNGEGEE